jgi:hypothetical protein
MMYGYYVSQFEEIPQLRSSASRIGMSGDISVTVCVYTCSRDV